ncbi:MAG: hypothetical protein LBO81_06220, partial [Clostridiales Family XIII bacterium]|jgi:hypothetical protein|nr:hypothetical protein [Clostridiales Family XIII bacterium]
VHSYTGKPGQIVAIPLDANAAAMTFRVGIIRHRDRVRSSVGDLFCDILKQIVRNFALQEHKKRYF